MTGPPRTVVGVIDEVLADTEGLPRQERARRIGDAVNELLGPEHVVIIGEDRWSLEHPLGCRLAGLENCSIHARFGPWLEKRVAELEEQASEQNESSSVSFRSDPPPPLPLGRHTVVEDGDRFVVTPES